MLRMDMYGNKDTLYLDPGSMPDCGESLRQFSIDNRIHRIDIKADPSIWGDPRIRSDVLLAAASVLETDGFVTVPSPEYRDFFLSQDIMEPCVIRDPLKPDLHKSSYSVLFRGMEGILKRPELMPHQVEAIKVWMRMGRRGLWGHDMGLGKTFTAGYLLYLNHLQRKYDLILVFTLASIIPKWSEMLTKLNVPHIVVDKHTDTLNIPHGMVVLCSTGRVGRIYPPKDMSEKEKDRFNRKPLIERLRPRFDPGQFALVIFDESHALNNISNHIVLLLRRVILPETHVLFMSGTPFGNGYHEAFPQMQLIKPGIFVAQTQGDFNRLYCENKSRDTRYELFRINPYKTKELLDKITTVTDFRKNVPGVVLPPFREDDVPYDLTPEQKAVLQSVSKSYVMPLPEEPPVWLKELCPDGIPVTSHSVLLHLKRMICSGHVKAMIRVPGMPEEYNEKGYPLIFNVPNNKDGMLLDHINAMGDTQSIIWVSYTETSSHIFEYLKGKGINCARIYGGTPFKKKMTAIADFLSGKIRHLISHPKCIGTGLDFINAREHISHEITYSGIEYEQAKKRSHRIGQTHPVVMRRYYGRGSVEWNIIRALDLKLDFMAELYATEKIPKPYVDIKWAVQEDQGSEDENGSVPCVDGNGDPVDSGAVS